MTRLMGVVRFVLICLLVGFLIGAGIVWVLA